MCLIEYARLAKNILNQNTGYIKQKKLIQNEFFSGNELSFTDRTYLRFTIIDSFYSTNMRLRYYSLEDITDAITQEFNSEEDIIESANECKSKVANNENNFRLNKIFNKTYGVNKDGESKKKACSLITKYLYFITKFNFPIYDSLVIESYPKIFKRFQIDGLLRNNNTNELLLTIKNLTKLFEKINDWDILDNLLWLIGKINNGNYSLILDKNCFLELTNCAFPNRNNLQLSSKEKDREIKKYVFNNICILGNIFNPEMQKFISFVKTLQRS